MEATAAAVVAEEEKLRRNAYRRMPTKPIIGSGRAAARYREAMREELQAQTCTGGCAKCGEIFTGNAFEVIQAQAKHREEVHAIELRKRHAPNERPHKNKRDFSHVPPLVIDALRELGTRARTKLSPVISRCTTSRRRVSKWSSGNCARKAALTLPAATGACGGWSRMSDFPDDDVHAFIRTHHDAGYWSRDRVEREMSIDDERIALELAERYLFWLMILLDAEEPDMHKEVAAQMIYLTGFLDAKAAGREL